VPKSEIKEFKKFIQSVKRKKKLALKVEKDFIHIAAEGQRVLSLPLRASVFQKDLKDILFDTGIEKYGYNLKSQIPLLDNANFALQGVAFDLQIAAYLLNYPLEGASLENVFDEKRNLEEKLKRENLFSLFQKIEVPLIEILADMEKTGITLKEEILIKISKELDERIKGLSGEIYEIAGEKFNIASPRQLALILFGKLGLPPVKKKKSGFSTDAGVLEILSKTHILPQKLLEYREASKLKSTYVEVLPKLIDSKDGRLHTSYHQTVTSTGRLSSSNPNLQNIPVRSAWGKRLREAFTSSSLDYFLLGGDYSQVELRLLAHFSQDKLLMGSFKNGEDIHEKTAQEIFELEGAKVDTDLRRMAKTINFGIIYGMSAYGLSRSLKIEVNQAEDFINRYFAKYQGVKEYIEKTIEEAKTKGYVKTMFGKKRYIPEISSSNRQKKEFAYRVAINTPIQGSAAEIIKLAMIKIWGKLKQKKLAAKMILQIHDELILEVPKEEVEEVKKMVEAGMENIVPLSIPLKVNLSLGRTWAEI